MKKIIIPLLLTLLFICSTTYATITDTTQRVRHTATADQTVFAYTWRILDQDDLDVSVNGVISTAYSVSNVGVATGGNVTFNSGRTSGDIIVIIRNMPETQGTSYPAGGRLSTVNLEKSLDNAVMLIQDLEEEMERAVQMPATDTLTNLDAPTGSSATDRADKVWAWDSTGTVLELIVSTNVDATSVIASQGDLVQGNSSGAAAKLAIGNPGDVITVSSGSWKTERSRNVAWAKGTDIAGAAALAIPDEDANYFDVTGTPTVTSISRTNFSVGSMVRFHFDTIGTLTHNATDLVLPGSNDITVSVGDEFTFVQYAADDYRLVASTSAGALVEHAHVGTSTGGRVVPTNYRTGYSCRWASTTTLEVQAGVIDVDGTFVQDTGTTTLTLSTTTDWVSDIVGSTADTFGYVYINATGKIELDLNAPDETDVSGNTSGVLRYNDTGTDTTDRRNLGWFYMNTSTQLSDYEVGNLKDGDVQNSVTRTDTTNDTLNDTSFGSDLTNMTVHFYSSGRGLVDITGHVFFTSTSISTNEIEVEIHDGADIPTSKASSDEVITSATFSRQAKHAEKYPQGTTVFDVKGKISAGTATVADKTIIIHEF